MATRWLTSGRSSTRLMAEAISVLLPCSNRRWSCPRWKLAWGAEDELLSEARTSASTIAWRKRGTAGSGAPRVTVSWRPFCETVPSISPARLVVGTTLRGAIGAVGRGVGFLAGADVRGERSATTTLGGGISGVFVGVRGMLEQLASKPAEAMMTMRALPDMRTSLSCAA